MTVAIVAAAVLVLAAKPAHTAWAYRAERRRRTMAARRAKEAARGHAPRG